MSSLIRRMERLASRGGGAQKSSIGRGFATKIGVHNTCKCKK